VLSSSLGAQPLASGFIAATHACWWIVSGCGAAVFVLALVTTGRWARRTSKSAAHLFDDEPQLVAT
jgi:hypothetical protein